MTSGGSPTGSVLDTSAQSAYWASVLDEFLPGALALLNTTPGTAPMKVVEDGLALAAQALQCPFSFAAVAVRDHGGLKITSFEVEVVHRLTLYGSAPDGLLKGSLLHKGGLLGLVSQTDRAHTLCSGDPDALHAVGIECAVAAPLHLPGASEPRVIAVCNRAPRYKDRTPAHGVLFRIPYPPDEGCQVGLFAGNDRTLLRCVAAIVERVC